MNQKQISDKNDFTSGSITKKLIQFMVPIFGALVLQAMYGAVDILVVGWFGTSAGISGVSTGSNIVNLITFTVAGFSMGVTVLIGNYIGRKEPERAGKVIGGAICFFLAVSVLVSVVMLVFARPFAQLMQAPKEALDLTVLYVRICGGGIFFIIAYNLISSIFRGLGDSRLPLIFVGIACVVNIIGDLVLVGIFKMNVAGAAIATVAAQTVSVILSLLIIRKKELPFTLKKSDICFNEEIPNIIKVGMPIAFQEILTNVSFLVLCSVINGLGLEASAGYGVANKIVNFVMLVPSSLMQSMSSFVAQNVGAGKEKRAKQAMVTGMKIGCLVGVVIGLVAFFKGDIPSMIFSADPLVIAKSAEYLKGFSLEAVVTCILFSFMGYYNGHGQTMWVMTQGIAQSLLIRLPMSVMMSRLPNTNLTLIGLAAPTATIFGIVLNALYFVYFSKKMKKEKEWKTYQG